MRHSSTSFTVITGHEDPDKGGEIDWETVARLGGTIVILMGVGRLAKIVSRLLAGGLDPDTPAAAVRWGSRPEQHTVRATLATLADQHLEPPTTIVIGAVAALDLAWFETRPLFGRRVVVTRAREQASGLVRRLQQLGAEVIEAPAIVVTDPADGGAALADAVARLATYDWVVRHLRQRRSPAARARCTTAVTSAGCGWRPSARAPPRRCGPATSSPTSCPSGSWPRACSRPSRHVPAGAAGCCWPGPRWRATCCPTGCGPQGGRSTWSTPTAPRLPRSPTTPAPRSRRPTSSRSPRRPRSTGSSTRSAPMRCRRFVASIGPITSGTARDHGLTVDVEATDHSIPGLVDALVKSMGSRPAPT